MDRRNDPENPDSHSDEQFQKAYEVISLSYKGDEPDRLYREAIICFDSLIEISHGKETIREFAQRHSLDMKYLVDGASFVISKMHFNTENNYYITLGLPQHATPEELSRRWKKLIRLYHPDRQVGNEEWVSERAKKVNEAYTILKDETKRAEYDLRLAELVLRREFPHAPSHDSAQRHRPAGALSRRNSRKYSSRWNSLRPYVPKILFAVYILIALMAFGFIYIQNRSSDLEAELAPEAAKTKSSEQTRTVPDTAGTVPVVPVEPRINPVQSPRETKTPAAGTSPLRENNAERVQANLDLLSMPPKSPHAEQAQREDPPLKRAKIQKIPAEEVKPLQDMKQHAAALPKTEQITREEVEEFMERYVRAYTKSDLNTFLSLFSRSAMENNTLSFHDIRNVYKETFSEKINYYKISNMDIRISGMTAIVSGIYNVSRYVSARDQWVRYQGKIEWKLMRENHQLRIISTTYDK